MGSLFNTLLGHKFKRAPKFGNAQVAKRLDHVLTKLAVVCLENKLIFTKKIRLLTHCKDIQG